MCAYRLTDVVLFSHIVVVVEHFFYFVKQGKLSCVRHIHGCHHDNFVVSKRSKTRYEVVGDLPCRYNTPTCRYHLKQEQSFVS